MTRLQMSQVCLSLLFSHIFIIFFSPLACIAIFNPLGDGLEPSPYVLAWSFALMSQVEICGVTIQPRTQGFSFDARRKIPGYEVGNCPGILMWDSTPNNSINDLILDPSHWNLSSVRDNQKEFGTSYTKYIFS